MKSLQGSSSSNYDGAAVCPFAKMASSSVQKDQPLASSVARQEEDEANHNEQQHHQQPGACDSSSTSSWEPDSSQYEEDLAIMTQKCPVFQQQPQQQQNVNDATTNNQLQPRTITFSCPFKEQQQLAAAAAQNSNSNNDDDDVGGGTAAVMRETLLKIPPSHYDDPHFVRVMEGFHHRVAAAAAAAGSTADASGMQLLPKKCPVPSEIKGKISFRQAMESRSLAAIMARLAEEHYQQQQQQQQQEQQQESSNSQQQQRERTDSESTTAFSTEATTAAREASHQQQEQVADAAAVVAVSSLLDNKEALLSSLVEDPNVATAAATTPSTTTTASTTTDITTTATTTTTTTLTTASSLSHELKAGTAVSHQAAENVHFVRNFIRGKIDRHLYGKLVTSLYHIYTALELELDMHAPQHFASCHFPIELKRVAALQNDVEYWHGCSNTTTASSNNIATAALQMSPATRDYVERIHDIAKTNPLLLLAHSYTRYLGDLSGGKILARVARRALNLSKPINNSTTAGGAVPAGPVDGLHFYHFDKIESDKKFKDKYRQSLDDLHHLSPSEISQLVAEANVAFILNMRIFEELDVAANLPGAMVRPLQEALDYATATTNTTTESTSTNHPEEQECPFLKQQPKKVQATSTTTHGNKEGGGRCPWPFVVFHDPIQFVCDWQTMVLVIFIGLLMVWQKAATTTSTLT